jgi:hypothetical protein
VLGRAFSILISGIKNPPQKSSGIVKMYTMDFNSNKVIEKKEDLL